MGRNFLGLFIVSLAALFGSTARAQPYFNDRFGYKVDLPLSFEIVNAADNGDGLSLQTPDGSARLLVFGANIPESGFAAEVARRKQLDAHDGWDITYTKSGPNWASYSGLKGGKVIYNRAISLCDDTAGYFSIQYPAVQRKQYDTVVTKLTKTLTAPTRCD